MDSGEDIVVTAFTPRFSAAFDRLLKTEGGFVDDPVDRGGATKYGISLRFLVGAGAFDDDRDAIADFDLDFDGDIDGQDVRKLTRGDARFLYLRNFWQPLGADQLPQPLGEMLFDQAVNGGRAAAGKLLQRAVNQCLMHIWRIAGPQTLLRIDGAPGTVTREAVARVLRYPGQGMPALVAAFRAVVAERYREIVRRAPDQRRFLKGWLRRAEELGR